MRVREENVSMSSIAKAKERRRDMSNAEQRINYETIALLIANDVKQAPEPPMRKLRRGSESGANRA